VIELIGESGIEFVIIDAEHTSASLETIERLVLSAKVADTASLVRIAGHDPDYARRVLDMGADGIVVPRLRTREDLVRIVSATKYDPEGSRGLCSLTRSSRYTFGSTPEEFVRKNDETMILGLIENETAVENIDEIFDSGQLDAALLGPGDLSQSMGRIGALEDPEVRNKLEEVVEAGLRHEMSIGAYAISADDATDWMERGATFPVYSDVRLLRYALSEQIAST
jgi:2-keto-3-deoxy-L-rhamnonate aldolase RhmA